MATTYDLIVIGGGHNGLVAAAYLARAGTKVLSGSSGGAAGQRGGLTFLVSSWTLG